MQTVTLPNALDCSSAWKLDVVDEVASTNVLARELGPWHAVRANTQTEGRGRTGRHWVSDAGGLWLSAVVPCPGPRSRWKILPLAAGYAVIGALEELGVTGLRLRWPNDIMVGSRKLAGLLIERFTEETAVVGLGLNIFNYPEVAEAALTAQTARLADLVPGDYTIDEIAGLILRSLAQTHASILAAGFGPVADALNRMWAKRRLVAVTLHGSRLPYTGHFEGIDDQGRLRLALGCGGARLYEPTEVALLRDLE